MPGWLQTGYYIRIYNEDTKTYDYYWISHEENLVNYIFGQTAVDGVSFGSVSPGEETGFIEIADMEPSENHLYQVLIGVRTRCQFSVEIPSGISLWGTDQRKRPTASYREIAIITQDDSPFISPSWKTELFLLKNFYPWMNAYNPTDITLKPEVRFVGKMFQIEKVTNPDLLERLRRREIPSRPIPLGILPGKGRGT